jgi:hypothetical protein
MATANSDPGVLLEQKAQLERENEALRREVDYLLEVLHRYADWASDSGYVSLAADLKTLRDRR